MYQVFTIGSELIHTYNIFLLIGIICAALIVESQISHGNYTEKRALYLRLFMPIAIVFGLFGAALFEIFTQGISFSLHSFSRGLTFYGGFIAVSIVLIVYAHITKQAILDLLHFFTPALVIAHAFGRVGCFFAGCCYGSETQMPWGVSFPEDSLPFHTFGSHAIHPTQLYESGVLFLLFFVLRVIPYRFRFFVYAWVYGFARFYIEFFRADSRGELFFGSVLSPSQIISIVLVITAFVVWLYKKIHRN